MDNHDMKNNTRGGNNQNQNTRGINNQNRNMDMMHNYLIKYNIYFLSIDVK